jgi:hypothetical protein
VIQFYKKGDIFSVKRTNNVSGNDAMDVDHHDCHGEEADEVQDNNELKQFVNQNVILF